MTSPALSSAALRRRLPTRIVGREIHTYPLVTSTNDVLWELADQGAEEGTVVFAEEQTGGRGRMGRSWWSPRGRGIWMSVLLRPPTPEGAVPMTSIIGALATADAVRSITRLPAGIRWPNDVLVADRKVAGVLVERRRLAHGREVVLGIGVDVEGSPADMPEGLADVAVSLSEAAGEPVDRLALARALLVELDRWYRTKLDRDIASINRRWRSSSVTLGRRAVVEEHGRRYAGEVIDVDVRFGLALRLDSGSIRHFRGEHVTVVEHG